MPDDPKYTRVKATSGRPPLMKIVLNTTT